MSSAVAVTTQSPIPASVNAPLVALTVHTSAGVAAYDTVVTAPVGAVTVGAASPNITVAGV